MQTKQEWKDFAKGAAATAAIFLSASFIGQTAYAANSSCEEVEGFAATVMMARQKNVPMSAVIGEIRRVNEGDTPEMLKRIVLAAYKTPRYNSVEHQQNEIQNFANDVYSQCYSARMGVQQ